MSKRSGIHEPGANKPSRAEQLLWSRSSELTGRRGFLRDSSLAAMSLALGAAIPFARFMPQGLIPVALAQSHESFQLPGKDGLIVLGDRPINAETPPHLLDDEVTPASRLFVRNNGIPPELEGIDADSWTLQLSGEACIAEKTLTLAELKSRFPHHTLQLQLECAGNGRAEFSPATPGNQWGIGAVGCPQWTGVRVRDVLDYCGVKDNAVYLAYEGADRHLSGDPAKRPISRGVPMRKAMEDESLVAWAMNGEPLAPLHGFPLRLVCAGWPASVCGKWLTRLLIRDRVHDGEKMHGQSYRMPCKPVAPGAEVADADMCIIESMPVRSLVSYPKSGISHSLAVPLAVRGHAWAGDNTVQAVSVSIDFGQTWQETSLRAPLNRLAWQHWTTELSFEVPGYYEIWARAVDSAGRSQPMVIP
ncbi:MAG TPA: sulfite oxidase, partial [Xanthomonadales bacterium]|nr:sulfite oxidase [Xanthomonadales bacterium]